MSVRVDRLRQIAELARSVQGALELDGVLNQVTAAVRALRPDLRCNIRLLDRQAGGFRLVRDDGVSAERAAVLRFGEGLTHALAETRRPLLVEDVQSDPRTLRPEWWSITGSAFSTACPSRPATSCWES